MTVVGLTLSTPAILLKQALLRSALASAEMGKSTQERVAMTEGKGAATAAVLRLPILSTNALPLLRVLRSALLNAEMGKSI